MSKRKPSRKDLLVVIARLQNHFSEALALVDDDRHSDRKVQLRGALNNGFTLCVEATEQEPAPPAICGPWSL